MITYGPGGTPPRNTRSLLAYDDEEDGDYYDNDFGDYYRR